MEASYLSQRFERLLANLGVRPTARRSAWSEVRHRYAEPHRRYHNLGHVADLLGWLDWFGVYADDADAVELAVWFHDLVYDPKRVDNEVQSAARLRALLGGHLEHARMERATQAILATVEHRGEDADTQLLLDLDLTVLASPPPKYRRYVSSIRQEYRHAEDDAFQHGRRAFLQSMLRRPRIYAVPALSELLESRARDNLRAELTAASSPW